ncbi:hypothetical protein BGZ47_003717 [Haplosporangium gracile]|nr:hypothetical protein BGZ47_003717 [Haplosporangium gracile]
MVKISLSLTALVATVVSAVPCSQTSMHHSHFYNEPNQCIPETTILEYQSFLLQSSNLNTIVSRYVDDDLLVGGINGNKELEQLEMCIVSTDAPCNPPYPTHCIYQNVEYRFRIESPIQGYLQVQGDLVTIVPDFNAASPLNLYKEEGWGLRIAQNQPDGSRLVFVTQGQGNPITLERPVMNASRQWFTLIPSNFMGRFKKMW